VHREYGNQEQNQMVQAFRGLHGETSSGLPARSWGENDRAA
jgi:hypothetical protein